MVFSPPSFLSPSLFSSALLSFFFLIAAVHAASRGRLYNPSIPLYSSFRSRQRWWRRSLPPHRIISNSSTETFSDVAPGAYGVPFLARAVPRRKLDRISDALFVHPMFPYTLAPRVNYNKIIQFRRRVNEDLPLAAGPAGCIAILRVNDSLQLVYPVVALDIVQMRRSNWLSIVSLQFLQTYRASARHPIEARLSPPIDGTRGVLRFRPIRSSLTQDPETSSNEGMRGGAREKDGKRKRERQGRSCVGMWQIAEPPAWKGTGPRRVEAPSRRTK